MSPALRRSALVAALAAALPASAVTLNTDGLGQALIYPYYTAQSAGNDAYNTYISVVNHTPDAKALRVRFREGRLGKSVLDMNVYLSPNDVWTGAVVPTGEGARLVTSDKSCTEPAAGAGFDLRSDAFASDGGGTGLDRTREGFTEIIEMATLTGASAAAVTHNSAGVPANCASVLGATPLVAAPTGGLSGTLTLINVATGIDFTLNAVALDGLAQRPFFRPPSDGYPGFNAAEIDPVSIVDANGATYRSVWSRPVDAVSAVLMRERAIAEYVLDEGTASQTDVVLTFPTRQFYAGADGASPPFTGWMRWAPGCLIGGSPVDYLSVSFFDREERGASIMNDQPLRPDPFPATCASAGVASVWNTSLPQDATPPVTSSAVLGSRTLGLPGSAYSAGSLPVTPSSVFSNGWLSIQPSRDGARVQGLVSTAASTLVKSSTGEVRTGPHTFLGLPMLGFSARIFRNGSLKCDAGTCQGNYGGAFPFKYRRSVSPAP